MSKAQFPDFSSHDRELGAAIAAYLSAPERGERTERAALLARHPAVAEELAAFFDNYDRFTGLAEHGSREPPVDARARIQERAETEASANIATLTVSPRDRGGPTAEARGNDMVGPFLRRFGDYELLEEIARGGMGIVYRARQVSLDRIVAIKMIGAGAAANEQDVLRFQREAAAAASLQHPYIVGVHEVGHCEDQYFFSMECVSGTSLAHIKRRGPVPPKLAARYVRQIAEAISFAHQHGVVHRDIKPSNVLIDERDQARVTDFGLAKRIETDQKLTQTGQIVGTATYMSPEQAMGSAERVGPPSDIYSAGAVLYELLTGRPPFQGRTSLETLTHILEHDPKLPRQLNPSTPRELEMICLKCLEKNPRDRYATAAELADDLERYLNGDSISITGPHLLDRLVRTLERGHHDVEFRTWSRMLFHFAWIVPAANLLVFLARQAGWESLAILLSTRFAEFAAMAWIFWFYRRDWFPPQGKPSRQLWALWLGYVAGSVVLLWVEYRLHRPPAPFPQEALYPKLAILGSLGFIMMGSSYWGYCYLIGACLLLLALLMPLHLAWAPLVFGLGWGASLLVLARHLRHLAGAPPGAG
ncbi:MAG: serine/threonine protein kinase [Pirellulaceae bacterium]|nr:serine/threonine protein kinase [Pirellulaceae bacterium]